MAKRNAGLVTSQGDRAQRSNLARNLFDVDGRNVRVGVLSDSYNCALGPLAPGLRFTNASQDIANNDLPTDVLVLEDLRAAPSSACSDEGRAMMQIIHDVAPGAPLAFATAFGGEQAFADNIIALADAGSKVIVDDIIYFAEPMFLNGPVAQAVNTVKERGVAYFSSAGNNARASYQSKFVDSGTTGLNGGTLHSFAPTGTADPLQSITVQSLTDTLFVFQWDEPWFSVSGGDGSASDVDIYFTTDTGDFVESCFFSFADVCQFAGFDFNVGFDPVEFAEIINFGDTDVKLNVQFEVFEGPLPQFVKYVQYEFGPGSSLINEFDTKSGTVYGHANAEGAEAVGAAAFSNTTAFGPVVRGCSPACLEPFSSAGGTPLLLSETGVRLRSPKTLLKPGITAPDAADTTFFFTEINLPAAGEPDGFPNFFGTSAAAPHAAAVAALMIDQRNRDIAARRFILGPNQLSPDVIYAAMRLTARDMDSSAAIDATAPVDFERSFLFDFDSGFGLLDATRALLVTKGF
jgi:subtilisin family serine protease